MADPSADTIQVQQYIYGLAATPDVAASGICFAAHNQGLNRSADGGITWQAAFDSLAFTESIPATSVVVSANFANDRMVIAGVPGGMLVSADGGISWVSSLLPDPAPFISALVLSPDVGTDGYGFAGTLEDGVFVTNNHGKSWTAWNIGLLDHSVLCLAVSPAFARDRTVYAGTESGIYYSTNAGQFWRSLEFAIDDTPILSIALSPNYEQDQILFVGTASRGLFATRHGAQAAQLLPGTGDDIAVNAILVSAAYPQKPDLLVLLDDALLISRDAGKTWAACVSSTASSDAAISCLAAPLGLEPGCPLLIGFVDGQVQRTTIGAA